MIDILLTHPKTKQQLSVEVYVTSHDSPILSIAACRALELLRVADENICTIGTTISPENRTLPDADVMAQYGDLFRGKLGRIEGLVHLEIDSSFRPVQLPLRRTPVALRDRVEDELQRMVKE